MMATSVKHIEVPRVDYEKLSGDRIGETSELIRKRVQTVGWVLTNSGVATGRTPRPTSTLGKATPRAAWRISRTGQVFHAYFNLK